MRINKALLLSSTLVVTSNLLTGITFMGCNKSNDDDGSSTGGKNKKGSRNGNCDGCEALQTCRQELVELKAKCGGGGIATGFGNNNGNGAGNVTYVAATAAGPSYSAAAYRSASNNVVANNNVLYSPVQQYQQVTPIGANTGLLINKQFSASNTNVNAQMRPQVQVMGQHQPISSSSTFAQNASINTGNGGLLNNAFVGGNNGNGGNGGVGAGTFQQNFGMTAAVVNGQSSSATNSGMLDANFANEAFYINLGEDYSGTLDGDAAMGQFMASVGNDNFGGFQNSNFQTSQAGSSFNQSWSKTTNVCVHQITCLVKINNKSDRRVSHMFSVPQKGQHWLNPSAADILKSVVHVCNILEKKYKPISWLKRKLGIKHSSRQKTGILDMTCNGEHYINIKDYFTRKPEAAFCKTNKPISNGMPNHWSAEHMESCEAEYLTLTKAEWQEKLKAYNKKK